ncbi:type II toxin-antitoxin system RelE/ParE family toxin [Magnetospirillum moscoviense]|uniref:type II toxin-antitoxin system RelE/ParE family toxin n=1 Tax=Magnetospirillum moscoviense TaxID=1437059 RepID=UPI0008388535|nr:type II toxin-antitoxin system RelE/ParE family toxin [Magnetospirillum moscoviense]
MLADSANADIDEILSTVIPENEEAAWQWYTTLHAKFSMLADTPRLGRVREDLLPSVYVFPFVRYLIFYEIRPDCIRIVHVVHGARDVGTMFARD